MIRLFLWFIIIITVVVLGTTVKFGKRTLYGHIIAIWETPEAKDARDGIREKAGPVVNDVEKRAKHAIDDVTAKQPAPAKGSGTGTAAAPSKW